jgi:hypothetical protein
MFALHRPSSLKHETAIWFQRHSRSSPLTVIHHQLMRFLARRSWWIVALQIASRFRQIMAQLLVPCGVNAAFHCSRSQGMKTMTVPHTTAIATVRPSPLRLHLLAALSALALLAIPHLAHAQGIVGGAEEGARRGNRAAGPVGGVVGGAVGAGVGGVVGGVKGVLGVPDRRAHRSYHRRHRHHHHD